jgi:hypothetical protein
VAAAVAALAVLLLLDDPGATALVPPRGAGALPAIMLGVGLAALGLAQVLSIRRLLDHQHALARHGPRPGGLDDALVAAMFRIGWPVALAQYPLLLGMLHIGFSPPSTPLLALLCLLPLASLLLDHAHAGWTYRHLDDHAPAPSHPATASDCASGCAARRPCWSRLPRRGAARGPAGGVVATRRRAAAGPAGRPRHRERRGAAPLARLHGGATARLHPHGQLHPAALDAIARPMRRLATLGALGAASLGIAVLTAPTAPLLAATPLLLLLPALSALTLHLASVTCIKLGNPFPDRRRRAGRPARGSRRP